MSSSQHPLFAITTALFAVLLVLSGCTSGGGTEAGPGKIGTLYFENGTAAGKVTVKICRIEQQLSGTPVAKKAASEYWTQTQANGDIVVDTMDDGWYYVLGVTRDLKSLTDSVKYVHGVCDTFTDTLKSTATLTGRVQLRNGDDPRTVDIRMSISDVTITLTDEKGEFGIESVPCGTHKIRFASTLDNYNVFDTVMTFGAGQKDTIRNPIALPYHGSLLVTGFKNSVDTLRRSVTYHWDICKDTAFSEYVFEWKSWPGANIPNQHIIQDRTINKKSFYLQDSMMVRICIRNHNDEKHLYTPWAMARAVDLCTATTIKSFDARVLPIDFVIAGDTILVLEKINYDYGGFQIQKMLKNGDSADCMDISSYVNDPSGLTVTRDALYLLDRPENDSLCIRKIGDDSAAWCSIRVTADAEQKKQLGSSPAGDLFISSNVSLFRIDTSGMVAGILNNIRIPFAITNEHLYCTIKSPEQLNPEQQNKVYEIQEYSLAKELEMTKSMRFEDTTVLQRFDFKINTITVNNYGLIAVSIIEKSLYLFYTEKLNVIRLSFENNLIDMHLTDDNHLFILYTENVTSKFKMDILDLNPVLPRLKQ